MEDNETTFFRVFELGLVIGLIVSVVVILTYSFTPVGLDIIVSDPFRLPLKFLMFFGDFSLRIISYSMIAGGIANFVSVLLIFRLITNKDGSLNTQW